MKHPQTDRVRRTVAAFGLGLLVTFLGWSVFVAVVGGERLATGSFGDAFGAINSLAAALTACLALWSLKLQRQELSQTRQEIAEQRQEQILQNRILGAQMATQLIHSKHAHRANDFKVSVGKVVMGVGAGEHDKNRRDAVLRYMEFLRDWCQDLCELSSELGGIEKQLEVSQAPRAVPPELATGSAESSHTVPLAVVTSIVVVVVWGCMVWRFGVHAVGSGLFGDAFGPLTGLATVLAVLLSLSAISVQHEELHLTREEMSGQTFELQVHNLLTIANLRAQIQSFVGTLQSEVIDIALHPSKEHFSDEERKNLYVSLWTSLGGLSKASSEALAATILRLQLLQSEPLPSGSLGLGAGAPVQAGPGTTNQ